MRGARATTSSAVSTTGGRWPTRPSPFERGQSATTGYRRFDEEYRLLVEQAAADGSLEDPKIRQRLMRYYTKIQILRINGLRSLSSTLAGTKDPGVAALGATNKMFWSEMHKEAMELALDIFGPSSMLVDTGPSIGSWPGAVRDKRRPGYPVSPMLSAFFFSRSETIWGGTSQIQRNIVGERVLGLPKEPS
jgi:alkylation response protein AidB-like acyl-CoA dehydrogenase